MLADAVRRSYSRSEGVINPPPGIKHFQSHSIFKKKNKKTLSPHLVCVVIVLLYISKRTTPRCQETHEKTRISALFIEKPFKTILSDKQRLQICKLCKSLQRENRRIRRGDSLRLPWLAHCAVPMEFYSESPCDSFAIARMGF